MSDRFACYYEIKILNYEHPFIKKKYSTLHRNKKITISYRISQIRYLKKILLKETNVPLV